MPPSATQIESTRRQLREAMPIASRWAYFDHAAVAPISGPAADALRFWLEESSQHGDTRWLDWAQKLSETRVSAAGLLGAEIGEIALVPNTTVGINLVAEGLDWQAGDNVVTLDDEFPSNIYPWLNLASQGVETRRVATTDGRVDLDQLADACDARTRVVSVSWVGYANGCRRDLQAIGEIAHRHDALFFVDAIQALGVFPLNVAEVGIDGLAADGHKWLLGPEGAGIAYLSQASLARLRPTGVGWQSVQHAHDFSRIELKLKTTADRYEGGSHNMPGFLALGASIDLLVSLGVENVAAAILDFTDTACEQLANLGATICSPRTGDQRSGIVSFTLPDRDPDVVRKHCLQQGVALNCRAGRLRISAHAYNDQQDLAKLITALETAPL
ncbi:MAG: aminotransferase class V-fold PLP-dependent enzyme [Planctomycetes bacterium]|nr:aminotransferase class V-fold PLP-dependent enzyme [Planctomycetota bacterium]